MFGPSPGGLGITPDKWLGHYTPIVLYFIGFWPIFGNTHIHSDPIALYFLVLLNRIPGVTKFTFLGQNFKLAFTPLNLAQSSPFDHQNDEQDRAHLLKATCIFSWKTVDFFRVKQRAWSIKKHILPDKSWFSWKNHDFGLQTKKI